MEDEKNTELSGKNDQAAAETPASEVNLVTTDENDVSAPGGGNFPGNLKPAEDPEQQSWLLRLWADFLKSLSGSPGFLLDSGKKEKEGLALLDEPACEKLPDPEEKASSSLPQEAAPDAKKEEAEAGREKEDQPRSKKERGGLWRSGSYSDQPFRPRYTNARVELLKALPKVIISPEAYMRMLLYVEIGDKEVGWLGTVKLLPSGNFFIDQTYLLDQEVTAAETQLSNEGQSKLMEELLSSGSSEALDTVNRLRFWGHSHVRMGVSPSGTDENTMKRFGREGMPWYIRGIFNKVGDAQFAIYLYEDGYRILEAPWEVWDPITKRTLLTSASGSSSSPYYGKRDTHSSPSSFHAGYGVPGEYGNDLYGESAAYRYLDPNPSWREKSGVAANAAATPDKEENEARSETEKPASVTEAGADKPRQPNNRSSYQSLPKELIPGAELRAEVEAEFRLKVREKSWTSWFQRKSGEDHASEYEGHDRGKSSSPGKRLGAEDYDEADLIAMLEGFDVSDGGSGSGAIIPKDDKPARRKKLPASQADKDSQAEPSLSFIDRFIDSIIKFFNEIFGGAGK